MNKINFTPKDILQKDFKKKLNGYEPNDVDSYLDDIIKDYENFQRNINDLSQQVSQLNAENNQLKTKITELNNEVAGNANYTKPNQPGHSAQPVTPSFDDQHIDQSSKSNDEVPNNVTNMDILRRLSNLERKVFGESNN